MLKDLIFPEKGLLQNSQSFKNLLQKQNLRQGAFAKAFWSVVQKKNDVAFIAFLKGLSGINNPLNRVSAPDGSEEVSIYYPYSENFMPPVDTSDNPSPDLGPMTIVTATADADEGIGYIPYYDANGAVQYQEVIVNDDYAYENPTQIIGVNGIEPYTIEPISGALSVFPPSGPIDIPDLPRQVKQVYIGEVLCKHQFDALISFTGNGGGSEIRFTRGDGFLKQQDGQISDADVFLVNGMHSIPRGKIAHGGTWVDWTVAWDEDWEPDNREQFFAIYEDDNRNSINFTFGLKTTLKITNNISIEGNIGGTLNFKSDDQLIKQTNYKYDVFFPLNRTDLEGEMRNGWPVRDKNGSVSFTLLDRTYY